MAWNVQTGPLKHQLLAGLDVTKFKQSKDEGFSCPGCYPDYYPYPSPPPINIYNPQPSAPFAYGAFNSLKYRSGQTGLYLQDQLSWEDRVHVVLGVRRDKATSTRNGVDELDQTATSFRGGIIGQVGFGSRPISTTRSPFCQCLGATSMAMPTSPSRPVNTRPV